MIRVCHRDGKKQTSIRLNITCMKMKMCHWVFYWHFNFFYRFLSFLLKNHYLCLVIAFAESPLGGMRARHIHIKRRNWTLWFWRSRISQIQTDCQEQSNGDAPWDVYIQPALVVGVSSMTLQGEIYIHRRGAFSVARFDNQGNARALLRGTSIRLAPRFLCVCTRAYLRGLSIWGRLMRRGF